MRNDRLRTPALQGIGGHWRRGNAPEKVGQAMSNNTLTLWVAGIEAAIAFILSAVMWWLEKRRDKRWEREQEEKYHKPLDGEEQ